MAVALGVSTPQDLDARRSGATAGARLTHPPPLHGRTRLQRRFANLLSRRCFFAVPIPRRAHLRVPNRKLALIIHPQVLSFALTTQVMVSQQCPRGGIGRRARFRFSLIIKDLRITTCLHKDLRGHQLSGERTQEDHFGLIFVAVGSQKGYKIRPSHAALLIHHIAC